MLQVITVCVMYIRYPNREEPLCGFVGSEEEARSIDRLLRSIPGGMIGTWEDFKNVTINDPHQILYAVFSGVVGKEYDSMSDPICYGIFTDRVDAEEAAKPRTKAELRSHVRKYVLPFRLGWLSDQYFPNGTAWPPHTPPPHHQISTIQPHPGILYA